MRQECFWLEWARLELETRRVLSVLLGLASALLVDNHDRYDPHEIQIRIELLWLRSDTRFFFYEAMH